MSTLQLKLRGTGVALITPFDKKGNVDHVALARLIKHILKGKCEYVVAMGTTGESVTLSKEEKKAVLRTVVNTVNSKVPVVLGLGGNNTAELISSIKDYDLKGVDAFLSVSPYYNKPSQAGIIAHFRALSKASPLPILLYNVPGRTGSNILPATTLTLAEEKNIIGIKEASGSLEQIMDLLYQRKKDFLIISGDDHLALPLAAMGADGIISVIANAFPAEFSEMMRSGLDSKMEKARKIHYRLLPFIPLLFREGNPAGVKFVLEQMNICSETVRLPLVPVSKGLGKEMQTLLKTINK